MPNTEHVMTSIKCTWIKRLFLNNTKWTRLFKATNSLTTNKIINYGDYFFIQQKENILNQFWRDVLFSWVLVQQKQNVQNSEDIQGINIWYNTNILKESKPFLYCQYIKKELFLSGIYFKLELF